MAEKEAGIPEKAGTQSGQIEIEATVTRAVVQAAVDAETTTTERRKVNQVEDNIGSR
jgi:hypothetical protein